jgi:minor extracellular serine protease Vpr
MHRRHPSALRIVAGVALLAGLVGASAASGEVLLDDDFDGSALDPARWFQPVGEGTFLGRTQLRAPSDPVGVVGGVLRLALDTHNPTARVPGDSFLGSEIVSQEAFSPAQGEGGIAIEARVRLVPPLAPGLVASLFLYDLVGPGIRDEIDFELLTNFALSAGDELLTNAFDDAGFAEPGAVATKQVHGLDPTAFNVYTLWWRSDRIQWFVNGDLVRQEFLVLPQAPLRVRLNLWAPAPAFALAYSAALQPTADPNANETLFYEVDRVRVTTLPEPGPMPGLAAALPLLAGLARLRARMGRKNMPKQRITAVLVGLLLASPPTAALSQEPIVEQRGTHWLVELESPPATRGGDRGALRQEKGAFRAAAQQAGLRYREEFAYGELWNGIAIEIAPGELGALHELPGVKAIHPVDEFQPDLASSVPMTGADIARSSLGYTGAGVRVGIIDSGIDTDHPDLGGCFGPGCRVATGWDFVSGDADPDDCSGHGTHVAGIVGASGSVTGMAPGVSFGAYRIFDCTGGAPSSRILAALERAYLDGMDVVNLSLGSPHQWPQHPLAAAATNLADAGVVVVASIGNQGQDSLWAAGAPGVGTKVIGVAASENVAIDRPYFSVTPDAAPIGYEELLGSAEVPSSGSFPLERSGTRESVDDACSPLPPASLAGAVALVRRGTCTFFEKTTNALDAGAVAVVIYNHEPGFFSGTLLDDFEVPVVGISDVQGLLLDGRLESGSVEMTWQPGLARVPNPRGGLVASFSSYGASPDLDLKPDLAAPGQGIRSTYPIELGGHVSLSGTSMASPHVAGAAALLLEAQPGMRSQLVGAVLQNSADPALWTLDPTRGRLDSVHRQGAGMLDVDDAIRATVRIEPSELRLGEGESGPVTRTLWLESHDSSAITFDLSWESAMATEGVIRPTRTFESTETIAFRAKGGPIHSVTVPAGRSAQVRVTVTPGADGAGGRGLYGGYVFFTPRGGGPRYSVPYLGVEGDYQEIPVNANPNYPRVTDALFAADDHFTMVGDDTPTFLVHLRHQVRLLRFEVASTAGKPWHRAFPDFQYVARNAIANSAFAIPWDGTTTVGRKTWVLPNGDYLVTISMLKANGDHWNPLHWEIVTLGPIAIERPEAPPAGAAGSRPSWARGRVRP